MPPQAKSDANAGSVAPPQRGLTTTQQQGAVVVGAAGIIVVVLVLLLCGSKQSRRHARSRQSASTPDKGGGVWLESWYHGQLSAGSAEKRLRAGGAPRAFLVWARDAFGTDHVVSYLNTHGMVQHAVLRIDASAGFVSDQMPGEAHSSLVEAVAGMRRRLGLEAAVTRPSASNRGTATTTSLSTAANMLPGADAGGGQALGGVPEDMIEKTPEGRFVPYLNELAVLPRGGALYVRAISSTRADGVFVPLNVGVPQPTVPLYQNVDDQQQAGTSDTMGTLTLGSSSARLYAQVAGMVGTFVCVDAPRLQPGQWNTCNLFTRRDGSNPNLSSSGSGSDEFTLLPPAQPGEVRTWDSFASSYLNCSDDSPFNTLLGGGQRGQAAPVTDGVVMYGEGSPPRTNNNRGAEGVVMYGEGDQGGRARAPHQRLGQVQQPPPPQQYDTAGSGPYEMAYPAASSTASSASLSAITSVDGYEEVPGADESLPRGFSAAVAQRLGGDANSNDFGFGSLLRDDKSTTIVSGKVYIKTTLLDEQNEDGSSQNGVPSSDDPHHSKRKQQRPYSGWELQGFEDIHPPVLVQDPSAHAIKIAELPPDQSTPTTIRRQALAADDTGASPSPQGGRRALRLAPSDNVYEGFVEEDEEDGDGDDNGDGTQAAVTVMELDGKGYQRLRRATGDAEVDSFRSRKYSNLLPQQRASPLAWASELCLHGLINRTEAERRLHLALHSDTMMPERASGPAARPAKRALYLIREKSAVEEDPFVFVLSIAVDNEVIHHQIALYADSVTLDGAPLSIEPEARDAVRFALDRFQETKHVVAKPLAPASSAI